MSKLTLRPFVAADWTWMNKLAANVRLAPGGVTSPGVFTYVCEEAGKPVGFAMGRAELGRNAKDTTPRTCELLVGPRTLIAGRWDIFLALMERHGQNGIDTGHTYAVARLPMVGQCTNIAETPLLAGELSTRIGARWQDEGRDTVTQAVARKQMEPVELKPLMAALKTQLDKMSCVRTWK